jgi:hypothetical protein
MTSPRAVFFTSADRLSRMARIAFGVLVVVLAGGAGCEGDKAISAPTGADGGERGQSQSPSGVWTNRTQGTLASGQEWLAVASDASGEHLVAVSSTATSPGSLVSGYWTSANSGSSWAHVGQVDGKGSVASNAAGTVFIAAGGGGGILDDQPIWKLTNSGADWALMELPLSSSSVASDATGAHFVAGSEHGEIWTSSNSGASWTNQTPSGPAHDQNWISIASSASGTKLVAVSGGNNAANCPLDCPPFGDVWTSSDSGVTWIDRTATGPAHGVHWTSVASDASGMNLVAGGSGIWTSADAGLTWTERTVPSGLSSSSDFWVSVASDATGKRLLAATYGDPGTGGSAGGGGGFQPQVAGNIFTSTNAGVSWANETAGTAAADQNWIGVASDSSGAHLVAVANLGDIWTN